MPTVRNLLLLFITLLLVQGCSSQATSSDSKKKSQKKNKKQAGKKKKTKLIAGGVYYSKDEDGKYTITKILALDGRAVHVRFYNEKFDAKPKKIDTAKLTYFLGHAPMARAGFEKTKHQYIKTEPVSEDELVGYRIYLEAMKKTAPK